MQPHLPASSLASNLHAHPLPRRHLRRIQGQAAAEEQRLLQGDASPASSGCPLESEDSEEAGMGPAWGGPKALPRLGGGAPAAASAAAAALDLLPEQESSGEGGYPTSPSGPRSRLSLSSAAGAEEGVGGGRYGAATIPAHRGSASHDGAARPSSTLRSSGSGSARLKANAAAAGRGGADVLEMEAGRQQGHSWHAGAGNDF